MPIVSDSQIQRPLEREVKRYAAYFRGWCQAFGEHDAQPPGDDAISWLVGERQIGLILPRPLTRALYREALRHQREPPLMTIGPQCLQVGAFHYRFKVPPATRALSTLKEMLQAPQSLHLYLSYHFMYPSGTRIITLSHSKPLHIIYKEIGAMRIRLLPGRGNGQHSNTDEPRP